MVRMLVCDVVCLLPATISIGGGLNLEKKEEKKTKKNACNIESAVRIA
jgi:hypothetical protein